MSEEVRITSATGGMKGQKPSQLGTVDPLALLHLGEVSGYGADKYGEAFNFLKGYDWRLSFDAMQRHALLFWAGEDIDEESGKLHMAHAAWHCLALVSFVLRDIGEDTRFRQGEKPSVADLFETAQEWAVGVRSLAERLTTQHGSCKL